METSPDFDVRLAVTAAAVAGDTAALDQIVSTLLSDGFSFEQVLFDVLMPVESGIGHRWQQNDYLVAEEHAATKAIEATIASFATFYGVHDRNAPAIVVTAAEGDAHSLPGRAVSTHLSSLGYKTVFLGENAVADELEEYLRLEPPTALVLSCSMSIHLLGARAVAAASHAAGVPVIGGGPGLGPDGRWASAVGVDQWVATLREVASTLEDWEPSPSETESRAVDPDDELLDLVARRHEVVGRAREALVRRSNGGTSSPRLLSELSLLFDAVVAAVYVDDPLALRDMLWWQRDTLTAQQIESGAAVPAALRDALADVSPGAAAMFDSAAGS